ncbi:MAG: hypothetical protein AUK55_09020 [Syntrophobacteraceae bacterium CG2_30_61_12]|nr:MAG: hypothetical protein AUK55_09020 [Syntrophobacteraceae bacterium CG2_30_61_12]
MREKDTGLNNIWARNRPAIKIAGAFALFSMVWIWASDRLLAMLVADPDTLTSFQSIKGWGFVLVTSVVLLVLVNREMRAEDAIRESEARLRLFIDHAPAALAMFDSRMCYLNASRRWLTDYNLGDRDLNGLSHYEVFPEIPEYWKAAHRRGLAGELVQAECDRFERADGTVQWLRWEVRPWHDSKGDVGGIVIFTEDITERKLAEATLQESEARLREQAAQLDLAQVFVRDLEDRIVRWNRGAERLYGYPAEEALGRAAAELLQTEFPKPREEIEAQVLQDGQWEGELVHTARDGHRVVVASLWVAYYNSDDLPSLTIEVNNDITAMKRVEEEIRRLNLGLEHRVADRTAQLESANQQLEAFSYSVSHDLRAPLRAISGFSQILARRHRSSLDEEGRRYMDNIVLASERMGELIDDLLEYSRLGRKAVTLRPVDLSLVLTQVTGDLAARIAEIGATITVPPDLPPVSGDPTLLQQIFSNLIGNAVIYHSLDAAPRVDVSCRSDGRYLIVSVADNGIGIAAEYLEKIFNVFQRLHSEEEYPGTGIGLAIVKKSVAMLGGEVWVESKLGVGSTFFVRLEQAEPIDPRPQQPAA